jgi:hypothetical protein
VQEFGGFILKQITNLYFILPSIVWQGRTGEDAAPPPEPHEYGGRAATLEYGEAAALTAAAEAKATGQDAGRAAMQSLAEGDRAVMSDFDKALAAFAASFLDAETTPKH